MLFESYEIIKEPGRVKLYTEMLVQFENNCSENIQNGTPNWWVDYILQNINVEHYHIYFICSCTVPRGKYNRVTDYKKVWGLNKLERGIYDNTYLNNVGKVYFGIIRAQGESAFRSNAAATILLVKKECKILCEDIFEIFQKHQYDFDRFIDSNDLILAQVCELSKNSILLRYNCTGEINLNIYGESIEKLFSELDVSKYNNCEEEVVYRKP